MRQRLADERMTVVDLDQPPGDRQDAEATAREAHRTGAEWVVADGYAFGEAF